MTHRLELALGHVFTAPSLLRTALTHRSHSADHNERLEFLGDSILNATIARLLFDRFPSLPEGDLSRLRANLVRQETLHKLALGIHLGTHLRLGEGELKSGGAGRTSILADALEALFGAVWLDAGCDAAHAVISRLYGNLVEAIDPGRPQKDAKTRLQEYLQGRRLPLPKYSLLSTEGEAHLQRFKVACDVDSIKLHTEAVAGSRRAAEQLAAECALERILNT